MRLVFPVMLILLGVVLVGFLLANPSERVTITLIDTVYPDVPLSLVALIALAVGVAFTAAVALIEGASIRLVNRRLRREIQRLETENSFLRSQSASPQLESRAPATGSGAPERAAEPGEDRPASAPVYDPGRIVSASLGE